MNGFASKVGGRGQRGSPRLCASWTSFPRPPPHDVVSSAAIPRAACRTTTPPLPQAALTVRLSTGRSAIAELTSGPRWDWPVTSLDNMLPTKIASTWSTPASAIASRQRSWPNSEATDCRDWPPELANAQDRDVSVHRSSVNRLPNRIILEPNRLLIVLTESTPVQVELTTTLLTKEPCAAERDKRNQRQPRLAIPAVPSQSLCQEVREQVGPHRKCRSVRSFGLRRQQPPPNLADRFI